MISQLATATPFGDAIANYTNTTIVQNTGPYFPDVNWQKSGHIEAWIDIVGFRNMTKENGTYYIFGDPVDMAIVQYDVRYKISGYFDSITKSLSYSQSENNLTVLLKVVLKWHVYCCDKDGCWVCGRFKEEKTFNDIEVIPKIFIFHNLINASVVFYNNSYSPKAIINVGKYPTVSERYTYHNQSIEHISKLGLIEKTTKGVKYVALYPANVWKNGNESLFSTMHNSVVIRDANFSMSNLTVTAIYPYDIAIDSTLLDYSEIKYNPYETFHPLFYFILFLALIPLWFVSKVTKRFNL